MDFDFETMLNDIFHSIDSLGYVHTKDIPNIELYMDQLTTFMGSQLDSTKRYEKDKILTKTMINNYTKNNLLPPSNKKKYSQEHLILLVFIYYFKSFLSIKDIEALLKPLSETYFSSENNSDLFSIYEKIVDMVKDCLPDLKDSLTKCFEHSKDHFSDMDGDEQYLQLFTFICNMSFDVYMKKMLIERLIDEFLIDEEQKK